MVYLKLMMNGSGARTAYWSRLRHKQKLRIDISPRRSLSRLPAHQERRKITRWLNDVPLPPSPTRAVKLASIRTAIPGPDVTSL